MWTAPGRFVEVRLPEPEPSAGVLLGGGKGKRVTLPDGSVACQKVIQLQSASRSTSRPLPVQAMAN